MLEAEPHEGHGAVPQTLERIAGRLDRLAHRGPERLPHTDADGGELRAEGRVVHRGRKVRTAEATLTDEAGRLIATATSSLMVLPLGG